MTSVFKNRMAALMLAILASPVATLAQEKDSTTPWKNVVNADDTFVFYVLLGLAILLVVLIWVVSSVTKGLTSDSSIWKNKWTANSVVALLASTSLFAFPNAALAAGETAVTPLFEMSDSLFWIMILLNMFLVGILFLMLYNLSLLIHALRPATQVEEPTLFEKLEKVLTASVPMEREADIMTDHSYDGIRELDNRLPPWWVYMFYATIFFAVVYLYHFQISPIPGLDKLILLGPVEKGTQIDQYNLAMAEADSAKAQFLATSATAVDENSVTLLTDAASLAKGAETFKSLCIACHSANAAGAPNSVGPNLIDQFWIHGGGIQNIFKTIKYGVAEKGMISWEAQLSPLQMQEVSSWIWSLQGTTAAGGKDPQGDKWVDTGMVTTATDSTAVTTDTTAAAVSK